MFVQKLTILISTIIIASYFENGLAQNRLRGREFCRKKYEVCMGRKSHEKLKLTQEYCDRVIKRRYYCVNRNLGNGYSDESIGSNSDSFEHDSSKSSSRESYERKNGGKDNNRNGDFGTRLIVDGLGLMVNMGEKILNQVVLVPG